MPGKKKKSNRKAKDSVFTNLFTIPKYRYQLFKELHPEVKGITEDDIEIVTLEHVLMNNEYNDLSYTGRGAIYMECKYTDTFSSVSGFNI